MYYFISKLWNVTSQVSTGMYIVLGFLITGGNITLQDMAVTLCTTKTDIKKFYKLSTEYLCDILWILVQER